MPKTRVNTVLSQRQIYRKVAEAVKTTFREIDNANSYKFNIPSSTCTLQSSSQKNNAYSKTDIYNPIESVSEVNNKQSFPDFDIEPGETADFNVEFDETSLDYYDDDLIEDNVPNTSSSQLSPKNALASNLQLWALKTNVAHSAVTELLHILAPLHPELPLDSRTLLQTPKKLSIEKMKNGEFHYFGIQNFILKHCYVLFYPS